MSMDFGDLKKTQRGRVLKLLLDLDWHPYLDLAAVGGVRYGARLRELKSLGYLVETRAVFGTAGAGFDYKLKSATPGKPQVKQVKVFLTEAQAAAILEAGHGAHPLPYLGQAHRAIKKALDSYRINKHKL